MDQDGVLQKGLRTNLLSPKALRSQQQEVGLTTGRLTSKKFCTIGFRRPWRGKSTETRTARPPLAIYSCLRKQVVQVMGVGGEPLQ